MGGVTLNQKRGLGCVTRGYDQGDKDYCEDCTQEEYSDKPETPPDHSPVVPKANLLLFDNRVDGNLCILSVRREKRLKRRRGKSIHIAILKYYSKTCGGRHSGQASPPSVT